MSESRRMILTCDLVVTPDLARQARDREIVIIANGFRVDMPDGECQCPVYPTVAHADRDAASFMPSVPPVRVPLADALKTLALHVQRATNAITSLAVAANEDGTESAPMSAVERHLLDATIALLRTPTDAPDGAWDKAYQVKLAADDALAFMVYESDRLAAEASK